VDAGPTPQQEIALGDLQRDAQSVLERWKSVPPEVATLNSQLKSDGVEPIKFP